MQQLVFTNSVGMEQVRYNYVVLGIDRGIVAERQWPVVVRPNEWPPNTVLDLLEQMKCVWKATHLIISNSFPLR
jgi:hypothetical protein